MLKFKIIWFPISKWTFHVIALTETNGVGGQILLLPSLPNGLLLLYDSSIFENLMNTGCQWHRGLGVLQQVSSNFAKLRNFWTPCSSIAHNLKTQAFLNFASIIPLGTLQTIRRAVTRRLEKCMHNQIAKKILASTKHQRFHWQTDERCQDTVFYAHAKEVTKCWRNPTRCGHFIWPYLIYKWCSICRSLVF
jgi:hypothetical protein